MSRKWIDWFLKALDSESVTPNQVLFYSLMVLNGLYNGLVASVPPQVLEDSLTRAQYHVFVWMATVAPALTILGKILRGKYAWTGAWLELFGDIGVCGACSTFVVAVCYTQWWGQGNFGTVFVFASAIGTTFFILKDVRRLAQRDRWVKIK